MVNKKSKLDKEEKEILEAIESGAWKPIKMKANERQEYIDAARNTMRKDSHLNIRISKADLEGLKVKAVREGMPYQTLIASILHKYLNGSLLPRPA
ncbi:MAG: putative DNA binding CopG/RHH family protein [Candidatus Omnitrophota bacterium]|jgi:predicted DNA binding CopG/RHH family protein